MQYLGTDPPTTGVGAVDLSKEPNYEATLPRPRPLCILCLALLRCCDAVARCLLATEQEMDEEHRRLLNIIREATSDSRIEPADRIVLRAQVGRPIVTVRQ